MALLPRRRPRHSRLSTYRFDSLDEVRQIAAEWLERYNEIRPHDASGSLPPARYLTVRIESSRTPALPNGENIGTKIREVVVRLKTALAQDVSAARAILSGKLGPVILEERDGVVWAQMEIDPVLLLATSGTRSIDEWPRFALTPARGATFNAASGMTQLHPGRPFRAAKEMLIASSCPGIGCLSSKRTTPLFQELATSRVSSQPACSPRVGTR